MATAATPAHKRFYGKYTDLVVIVPSRLAAEWRELAEVRILALPVAIPKFQIKQHWHERFHHDPGGAWLRGLVAELFQDWRPQVAALEAA